MTREYAGRVEDCAVSDEESFEEARSRLSRMTKKDLVNVALAHMAAHHSWEKQTSYWQRRFEETRDQAQKEIDLANQRFRDEQRRGNIALSLIDSISGVVSSVRMVYFDEPHDTQD